MSTTELITPPRAPNRPEPWSEARPAAVTDFTSGEIVDETLPLVPPAPEGPAAPAVDALSRARSACRRDRPAASGDMSPVSDADTASFQTVRPRLFGIAYRVLGSPTEADDVVQDAWIRWQGTDRSTVRDSAAFLAATTTRLAVNVGRSARARHETFIGPRPVEPVDIAADPSLDAEQHQALELAVRALVEMLSPTERAVYVLREAFDYPYRQIAELFALSEVNARQLVTRARRRLSGDQRRSVRAGDHRRLLEAFVAAAQAGDVATLEHVLVADVAG